MKQEHEHEPHNWICVDVAGVAYQQHGIDSYIEWNVRGAIQDPTINSHPYDVCCGCVSGDAVKQWKLASLEIPCDAERQIKSVKIWICLAVQTWVHRNVSRLVEKKSCRAGIA